jgi:hypothetical protein
MDSLGTLCGNLYSEFKSDEEIRYSRWAKKKYKRFNTWVKIEVTG